MALLSKASWLQTIMRHNLRQHVSVSIVLYILLGNSICATHMNQANSVIWVLYYSFLCAYYLEPDASKLFYFLNCSVNWQLALRASSFEDKWLEAVFSSCSLRTAFVNWLNWKAYILKLEKKKGFLMHLPD